MTRVMITLIIILAPPIISADITLYSCEKNGTAVLTDKPVEGCENLLIHTYESSQTQENKQQGSAILMLNPQKTTRP
jgi:hypothetical protein